MNTFFILFHLVSFRLTFAILRSNRQEAALKGTTSVGVQEKRKDRKTRKSTSEEKGVGFSSASLFPARKREAVTQGRTRGIDHPTRRITLRASIIKDWEDILDTS